MRAVVLSVIATLAVAVPSAHAEYRITGHGVGLATGRTRAHLHAPVTLSGASSLHVLGPAENGLTGGRYRGTVVLHRAGAEVLVVNDLGVERYLYGVVPAEMPATWPTEALRSQAVVARSYALTSRRPTRAAVRAAAGTAPRRCSAARPCRTCGRSRTRTTGSLRATTGR